MGEKKKRLSKDELRERREILADNQRFLKELRTKSAGIAVRHAEEIKDLMKETMARQQVESSDLERRIARTEEAIRTDEDLLASLKDGAENEGEGLTP